MSALLPLLALWLAGCTLVNHDLPNEPPTIQRGEADTLTVRRGGRVSVQIVAVDPDDDPLSYSWRAFTVSPAVAQAIADLGTTRFTTPQELRSLDGLLQLAIPASGFVDSAAAQVVWVAPTKTTAEATLFLLTVTVRDRFCDAIADPTEHATCVEQTPGQVQIFRVSVTQRPPTAQVPTDTVISFRDPWLTLQAKATDADGDPLTFSWSQVAGPVPLVISTDRTGAYPGRMRAVALAPGEYAFRVAISDGADSVVSESRVRVDANPAPPLGGMVTRDRGDGTTYQIDTYEYPDQKGTTPLLAGTWFEAARACAQEGKRLCTTEEWVGACTDDQRTMYSSTDTLQQLPSPFGVRFCNAKGSAIAGPQPDPVASLAPAGSFANCSTGDAQVYDLTGNAAEWVGDRDADGRWSGGLNLSDVSSWPPTPCAAVMPLPALPPGFDLGDPAAEAALGGEYGQYRSSGRGFRCCR